MIEKAAVLVNLSGDQLRQLRELVTSVHGERADTIRDETALLIVLDLAYERMRRRNARRALRARAEGRRDG